MDLSQELDQAIEASDVQRVTSLLQSNNVNLRAAENKHLLCLALTKNNTKIIELLIRAGADINFRDQSYREDRNILHQLIIEANKASQQDNNDEYTRLAVLAIEHGADINAREYHDYYDESVFECAVRCNSIEVMRELSKRGGHIMDQESFGFCAGLAIRGSNAMEALTLIIGLNDPSVEVRSERALGSTALTLQSDCYNFDVFQELLKMIMDLNQHDPDGDTLLYTAARFGRVDAATVLLDLGVDLDKKTTGGELPLFVAAKRDDTAMTELLISRGASIHDQNDDGKYPIHGACSSKTMDNLLCLLRHGASMNAKDKGGKYPIHIAASNDCFDIMLLLLMSRSPIQVTDNEGNSTFSLCKDMKVSLLCGFAFIMHCALEQITTGSENRLLTIIQASPPFLNFYRECCDELQLMKQIVVFENTTLLSLFVKNTSQLSVYYNNEEFAEAILNSMRENQANLHWYMVPFKIALETAKTKHIIIQNMKNLLVESFPFAIPYLAIEKITHYVVYDDLVRSEFDEYMSFYENHNEALTSALNLLNVTT